mmetsp:Transcript_17145/g.35275  ORF Transcript_17145/g.35275 Transcript_17145/m.35275 type:complete len:158 (-) Transcript_17145:57-530(-)
MSSFLIVSIMLQSITILFSPTSVSSFSPLPTFHNRPLHLQPTRLRLSVPKDEGIWTYMDGDDMDTIEGIEAMGGDPDFFTSPPPPSSPSASTPSPSNDSTSDPSNPPLSSSFKDALEDQGWGPLSGKGPRHDAVDVEEKMEEGWEWDGVEDESAYFD